MSALQKIAIEVACATLEKQRIVQLEVPVGTTARQAVAAANLQREFPELDLDALTLGIYGEVVADERVLQAGERVEIYRPLQHEPRETRRLQAHSQVKLAARSGTVKPRK